MTTQKRASVFGDEQPLDLSILTKPATPQNVTEELLEQVKETAEKRGFVSREPAPQKSGRKGPVAIPKPTGRPRSPLTEQMTYKARPDVVARFNQLRLDEGLAESGRIITQGDFLERLLSFYEEHNK